MSKINKVKCQMSKINKVKCQKSIRLITTERTSGVPPVIFYYDSHHRGVSTWNDIIGTLSEKSLG